MALHSGRYLTPRQALARRRRTWPRGACPPTRRLSRNAAKVEGARHERFVTQRCWAAGRTTARGHLDNLVTALRAGRYDLIDVEEEFVVYDSNLAVDAGWLDAEAGPTEIGGVT